MTIAVICATFLLALRTTERSTECAPRFLYLPEKISVTTGGLELSVALVVVTESYLATSDLEHLQVVARTDPKLLEKLIREFDHPGQGYSKEVALELNAAIKKAAIIDVVVFRSHQV